MANAAAEEVADETWVAEDGTAVVAEGRIERLEAGTFVPVGRMVDAAAAVAAEDNRVETAVLEPGG